MQEHHYGKALPFGDLRQTALYVLRAQAPGDGHRVSSEQMTRDPELGTDPGPLELLGVLGARIGFGKVEIL